MNPYDACVANKTVKGKQLTVTWHVDDLKISHVDNSVVEDFIEQMNMEFGKESPMNISRGNVHDYLGMNLDFSKQGELGVDMRAYIDVMLSDAPEDMKGAAVTPAASHLFKTSTEPTYLDKDKQETFIHLVMQSLYLSQRGRPDIRTAVSFLSTRLQRPDKDDYNKLTRMIKYLRKTRELVLRLKMGDFKGARWWIDASYAVHDDMKGHTGGTMTLGTGSVYSSSSKQKIATRSSTECEVVGVYDILPQIQWTDKFLKAQGLDLDVTIVYQDNMSAMLLEKNGRLSSTKRTKHMDVRYFYITDMVKRGQVKIEHCPTERMIADFFTKPLQGRLFRLLRDYVMGVVDHDDNNDDSSVNNDTHNGRQAPQECVGDGEEIHGASYADVTKYGVEARPQG